MLDEWELRVQRCFVSGESYCDVRVVELCQLGCWWSQWSYGLRIAEERSGHRSRPHSMDLPLMRSSIHSPVYMRDSHDDSVAREVMRSLEKNNSSSFPVNSSRAVVEKLKKLFGIEGVTCGGDVVGGDNLCMVHVDPTRAQEKGVFFSSFRFFLSRVGATPSLYSLLEYAHGKPSVALVSSGVSWQWEKTDFSLFPSDTTVSSFASRMVSGFEDVFCQCDSDDLRDVLRSCHHEIQSALCAMTTQKKKNAVSHVRQVRLAEVIADEIFVCLHAARPFRNRVEYELQQWALRRYSFVAAAEQQKIRSFLFSSGMDSISSSLVAGMSYCHVSDVHSITPDADYLELCYTLQDLKKNGNSEENPLVLMLTMNLAPSAPRAAADIIQIQHNIGIYEQRCRGQLIVLVDITIETVEIIELFHRQVVMQFPHVVFVLCKSFQKYATLGLAKVSGGAAIVLGSSPLADQLAHGLEHFASDLNWSNTPDAQMLAFLLKYCHEDELLLVANAAKGAAHLNQLWPGKYFVEGLPFVLYDKMTGRWDIEGRTVSMKQMAELLELEDRDSFASNCCAFLAMPEFIRINVAQESTQLLTERFFAPGLLLKPQEPDRPPHKIELREVLAIAPNDPWKKASLLRFAVLAFSESRETTKAIDDFLSSDESSSCISPDTWNLLAAYSTKHLMELPPVQRLHRLALLDEHQLKETFDQLVQMELLGATIKYLISKDLARFIPLSHVAGSEWEDVVRQAASKETAVDEEKNALEGAVSEASKSILSKLGDADAFAAELCRVVQDAPPDFVTLLMAVMSSSSQHAWVKSVCQKKVVFRSGNVDLVRKCLI